jgi:hypothetical protein
VTSPAERRYRRLLWAYPRSYRDHRGAEMLTTMLEMAEDGHRPGLHLVLSGLRQRFRLPARRPFVGVAALLAAVVLGGFGAAAGTWTAWRTATAVPSDAEIRALNASVTGMPAVSGLFHETSAQQGPSVLILADGTSPWSATRVRDTLTGAGWQVTSLRENQAMFAPREDSDAEFLTTNGAWTATRDGLRMHGSARTMAGTPFAAPDYYRFTVWPAEPAALRPLTVAGAVVGLLAGWLLVAALARRRLATALAAAGFAAAALPAYRFYHETHAVLAYEYGSPYPVTVDGSHGGVVTLVCAVAGLLAVAAAAILARPRREGRAGVPHAAPPPGSRHRVR